jgi:hypothetical protein
LLKTYSLIRSSTKNSCCACSITVSIDLLCGSLNMSSSSRHFILNRILCHWVYWHDSTPSVIPASLRPMMWSFDQSPLWTASKGFARRPRSYDCSSAHGPPSGSHEYFARINAHRGSQTANSPHLPCVDRSSSAACHLWPFADRAYNPSLRLLAEGSETPC